MSLLESINRISKEAKNKFKPDLKKYGRNYRAISESALLEVLNALFEQEKIAYDVRVRDQKLHIEKINAGRDVSGNLIQKLVFVAEVVVELRFHNTFDPVGGGYETASFEGWGSGVDSGDKATGKAITAATKYALLKGLRLQYSDDPDAEASEELENIIEEEKPALTPEKKEKKAEKCADDAYVSEKMTEFIMSLCKSLNISDDDFKKKFKFLPYDTKMPMKTGRAAIDYLKKVEDEMLPF